MATTYADKKIARALADRLEAAREKGWTRPALEEATGLSPAKLWRIEGGRAHADEVKIVSEVLARIESGELQAPERKQAERVNTLELVKKLAARVAELEARVAELAGEQA